MGKPENNAQATSSSQDNNNNQNNEEECCRRCCSRSTAKWIVALVVGVNVLLVGVYSLPFLRNHHGHGGHGSFPNSAVQVKASFMLTSPVSVVKNHVVDLEWDIEDEINVQNTKVKVISLKNSSMSNMTEVKFAVLPVNEGSPISTVDLSILRGVFLYLITGEYNLSLSSSEIFGNASSFQVLMFPGGITVVPEQKHFPLERRQVLFNFSLHNSIDQVLKNIDQLKQQLDAGLNIKQNENLFVQLTSSKGSTVDPPITVETSIVPVVGGNLPPPRLKQLAQEIKSNHSDNLGLNHKVFGKVKEIMLSKYLKDPEPPSPVPSPAPTPSQPPTPMATPIQHAAPPESHELTPAPSPAHCHHHHRHHHRHHHSHLVKCKHHHGSQGTVSGSSAPSPAPSWAPVPQRLHHRHHHHAIGSPLHNTNSPIAPVPSPSIQPPCSSIAPSSPSPSPKYKSIPPSVHHHSPTGQSIARPPTRSPPPDAHVVAPGSSQNLNTSSSVRATPFSKIMFSILMGAILIWLGLA